MGANNAPMEIPGETDPRIVRAKKQGKLTRKHLYQLYKKFCSIDRDSSGTIDISEFHAWLKEPRTLFTVAVFGLTDVCAIDKNLGGHGLNFPEFVSTLSAYCLMGPEDIVRFSYNVVDKEGNGHVDPIALGEMLTALHNDNMNSHDTEGMNALVHGFDDNGNGTIEYFEYEQMHGNYPHLLFPAFRLQQAMKFKTFGDKFWDDRRIRNADDRTAANDAGNQKRLEFMEKNLKLKKSLLRQDRHYMSAYFLNDTSPIYAANHKEPRMKLIGGSWFIPVAEHNIVMVTGGPKEKIKTKVGKSKVEKTEVEQIETPGDPNADGSAVATPAENDAPAEDAAEDDRAKRRRRTEARRSKRKAGPKAVVVPIAE